MVCGKESSITIILFHVLGLSCSMNTPSPLTQPTVEFGQSHIIGVQQTALINMTSLDKHCTPVAMDYWK